MVVEDDLLDVRIERDRLELAEPAGVRRLDDHQAPDRVSLEPRGVGEGELVRMQAGEIADGAGVGARGTGDGARGKAARTKATRATRQDRCGGGLYECH